jgi:hypothetical protein
LRAAEALTPKFVFSGIIPKFSNIYLASSNEIISKRDLSNIATDGTVYLTCWMTNAQLEQMKSKKVMFQNLD